MTTATNRIRSVGLGALVAALAACLTLAAPAANAKKKKKKGPGAVDITKAVNLPIPDAIDGPGANNPSGVLTSTIDVPKQFKGKKVRDVNVTVQTLGTGPSPTNDLDVSLVAPNGAVAFLFGGLSPPAASPGVSIGPLTLDDEALLDLGSGTIINPTRLYSPWAGTAAPEGELYPMDGGAVRGTWTLQVLDTDPPPAIETSTLVSWRLNVIAGRPFQTK